MRPIQRSKEPVRVLSEPRMAHNRVEKGRIVALWILNGEGMQSRS